MKKKEEEYKNINKSKKLKIDLNFCEHCSIWIHFTYSIQLIVYMEKRECVFSVCLVCLVCLVFSV
jgi:hypothetical protein